MCSLTLLTLNSGHVARKPLLMVGIIVASTSDPHAACGNRVIFSKFVLRIMQFAMLLCFRGSKSACHNPVMGFLVPLRIVSLLHAMLTSLLS